MRLLIVSPHFPPSNAADMQRVRLVLPYLRKEGIEAEVLAVEPEQVESPRDSWLVPGLPADVPIHRVRGLGVKWRCVPGLGTLTFRAFGVLRRRGDELLREGRFDLVYFSTTQFGVHGLGPYWKKHHGVPFVMDYQDPWVSDYYREHPEVTPPGGRLKYAISNWLSRRNEPRVLKKCSGVTSVSAEYLRQLANRYDFLKIELWGRKSIDEGQAPSSGVVGGVYTKNSTTPEPRLSIKAKSLPAVVLPFPGDERDLERVCAEGVMQSVFNPRDGFRHWVYVGRGGKDMAIAVRSLFRALKNHRAEDAELLKNLRIHFIGTSYAAPGRGVKSIEPIAVEEGLGEIVSEHPDRIAYSETLRSLLDADALMIPGSNDPGYTASKIYPYLLAGKPLLAIFHEQSSVVSLMESVAGGRIVPFGTGEEVNGIAERIRSEWLKEKRYEQLVPLDQQKFHPNTAEKQARELAEFFEMVMKDREK